MKKLITNFLTRLAKKYLGLVDKPEGNQLSYLQDMHGQMLCVQDLARELACEVKSLQLRNTYLNQTVATMREKYPTIWLKGDAAQGVVQIPKLGIACEFYREENKLCVFAPWNDAAGKKPTDFVPEWLEVDENLQVESIMDRSDKSGILYKIPVKGWSDDTLDLAKEGSHPNYSLDGRAMEKTKSFRCKASVNGTFRRELDRLDKLWCHLWFHEFDLPQPSNLNKRTVADFLPKGNMRMDPDRQWEFEPFGYPPDRIYHWKIPVVEELRPQIGYNKKTYIAPNPGFGEVAALLPGTELGNS
jgi:hypothetical protein